MTAILYRDPFGPQGKSTSASKRCKKRQRDNDYKKEMARIESVLTLITNVITIGVKDESSMQYPSLTSTLVSAVNLIKSTLKTTAIKPLQLLGGG